MINLVLKQKVDSKNSKKHQFSQHASHKKEIDF